MSFRLSLVDLARAGTRAVSRYTGTVFALFVAQGLVAAVAIVGVAQILAAQFAYRPRFDDAVDGDLVALLHVVRDVEHVVWTSGWLVFGVVLLWMVASWFLTGGALAVLVERPEGRATTARTFGAGGANTFLSFVWLSVLSLVAYLPALFVLGFGLAWGLERAEYALTVGDLLRSVGLGLVPGLLALLVVGTIVDYARVELVVRKSSHDLGAMAAFVRAIGFVLTNPVAIVHAALGWVITLAIAAGYVWVTHGRSLIGGSGALTILIVRQGVMLLRMAIKVAVLGGQVELGQTRLPPPRRATTENDATRARPRR